MRARVVVFWLVAAVVLVAALAVTGARLVDAGGRLGIALVAFTPLALPLYAALLLLALGRMVVLRGWRVDALPVALVAVAGLLLHGWWYAPQVSGANPPAADGATQVVVMTANLRLGEADGVEVVRTASEQGVDLLVLQEVTLAVLADMERAGLDALFPHRVGEPGTMATGTMAFSRTELTDAVRLPTALGSWSFRMDELQVFAVHPTYPVDAAGWRRDQATLVDAVTEQGPDLVVGDFNATVDHDSLRTLADRGYRDVGELANAGWHPTWPDGGEYHVVPVALAQIDHVLVGESLAAVSMSTREVPGSDHRAVVATVAAK
ncbi:endonuclease/exonuclease/phosphatase family protein [Nocardioides sp. YIM 152315]|uniref:endonuclease/exonuclease/phosphatase family protein n=1 Tax=Nocardioides sp. YIM 152315 TaxID=3031760 RepID=UPI0023DA8E75|nr:endonuclease/exonuclease/phosphatase family protein [Nocardioides sp. YIM 152315]MDF1605209.1 endonuclease/exonuclease/phosphatase family protein [Nocardioides sp. YIM 152315]